MRNCYVPIGKPFTWKCYLKKTVCSTETYIAENHLNILNCFGKCCAGSDERAANRLAGEGNAESGRMAWETDREIDTLSNPRVPHLPKNKAR